MAKITRQLLKLFGGSGTTSNFGQFGSLTAGSALNTKDIATIQALAAWINGWQDSVYGANKAPFLEDMNALCYVFGYQLAYLLQEGTPEWNTDTTYYIGSIVKKTGTSELYKSLTDANLANALPSKTDNVNWQYVINKGILQYDAAYTYSQKEIVQKPGTNELYSSAVNSNVGNALPSQATNAFWTYLVDLANLAPPPVGISKVQFGFAALTLSSTVSTTASVSKTPVGDFGFDSGCSVYAFVVMQSLSFNIQQADPAQNVVYNWLERIALSGSGVDASGNFLNGGSPSVAYTTTLTLTITGSGVGWNAIPANGFVVFIGVK